MKRHGLWRLAFVFLLAQVGGLLVAEEPGEPAPRRYEAGPLTGDDFLGKRPAGRRVPDGSVAALAYTATELRYTYRYRTWRRDGRWTAAVTEFDTFAVMLREQSWLLAKNDRRLLDHEQGHFDIAELWARRAKVEMQDALRRRQLRTSGSGEQEVIDSLQKRVDERVEQFRDAMLQAHRAYDQLTRYGTDARRQAEQRADQRAALGDGT